MYNSSPTISTIVCVTMTAATMNRNGSGSASANGKTTSEFRVALLNKTARLNETGKRNARVNHLDTYGMMTINST